MNYEGYNRALGKYISTKRQYENEMQRQGMVSQEKGEELARKAKERNQKPYVLGDKTKDLLTYANSIKDRKGNIKLGDRAIDAMKKMGMKFERPNVSGSGGFYAT